MSLVQNTYRNANKLDFFNSFISKIKYLKKNYMNIYNDSLSVNIHAVLQLLFYLFIRNVESQTSTPYGINIKKKKISKKWNMNKEWKFWSKT